MKQGIHPQYVECNGPLHLRQHLRVTRSTVSEMTVDLCDKCHPFYTGQQKLVDTGGRVQRFADKFGGAAAAQLEKAEAAKAARGRQGCRGSRPPRRPSAEAKAAAKAKRAAEYAEKAAAAEAAEAPAEAPVEEAAAEAETTEAARVNSSPRNHSHSWHEGRASIWVHGPFLFD